MLTRALGCWKFASGVPSVPFSLLRLGLGLEARLAPWKGLPGAWASLHSPQLGLYGIYAPDLFQSHGVWTRKIPGKDALCPGMGGLR